MTDNWGDPEMFPVGIFERQVFDSEETLTADEREWTQIKGIWIRDNPR
jgi:hypothetical protein